VSRGFEIGDDLACGGPGTVHFKILKIYYLDFVDYFNVKIHSFPNFNNFKFFRARVHFRQVEALLRSKYKHVI